MKAAGRRIASFIPSIYPVGKIKRYIERAAEPIPSRFFHYQLYLTEHADEFFTEDFKTGIDPKFALQMPQLHYQKAIAAAPLNRLLYMDLKMCIGDNDLFKVNRMAEGLGVKVCYPYLDRELGEVDRQNSGGFQAQGISKTLHLQESV